MAKLNAVIVLDCCDATRAQYNSVMAFTDDAEGIAKAEETFREWVREASPEELSDEDVDHCLDDGILEMGDGHIVILHTE